MPVDHRVSHGGLGVVFACHGAVSRGEFVAVKAHYLAARETTAKLLFALIDLTRAGAFSLTTDDIRLLAELDSQLAEILPNGFLVALVADTDLEFGLSRMWEALAGGVGWETRSFRSGAEAGAWIAKRLKERHGIELAGEFGFPR